VDKHFFECGGVRTGVGCDTTQSVENGFEPSVERRSGRDNDGAASHVPQLGAVGFDNTETGTAQTGVDSKNADYCHAGIRAWTRRGGLMAEMAVPGEYHGKAALVGCRDDFVVANAATRLNDTGGAGVGHDVQTVAKRKERVRGDRG